LIELAVAAFLAASTVDAQQPSVPDPLVREGATVRLAAHTYVIPDGNVSLVPNVGIVVGSKATLVIDPGLGRRNGETVLREMNRIGKPAEIFVASTHFHAEHTTGFAAFPASAKYVSAGVQERDFAEGGLQQIQAFSKRSPLTAELLRDAAAHRVDVRFDRDRVLDLGGVRVRLLVVGPTHTRGDTAFFVEEDRVLFAGDVVMNNSFLAATQVSSMKAWLAAFDSLENLRPATIVPAHGPVGPGSIIATNRALMRTIQTRAQELKALGRSAEDAAGTIQKELQVQHPDWPRANGIAAAARAAFYGGAVVPQPAVRGACTRLRASRRSSRLNSPSAASEATIPIPPISIFSTSHGP
jgi:glyoxylase-like metal-dependent hydrolase (beta-lactamase superfamily II)